MTDREKTIRGLEFHKKIWDNALSYRCENEFGIRCPYEECRPGCTRVLAVDAFGLLKEQEKEIKALRKLLDWAMECDFGIDNLGDWWTERFAEEIAGMGYKESLIHLAKRYIEVFEGGDGDA